MSKVIRGLLGWSNKRTEKHEALVAAETFRQSMYAVERRLLAAVAERDEAHALLAEWLDAMPWSREHVAKHALGSHESRTARLLAGVSEPGAAAAEASDQKPSDAPDGGLYVAVRAPGTTWFTYMGDLAPEEYVRIRASVRESMVAMGFAEVEA